MAERTYLYGYGRRRHISNGTQLRWTANSLCGSRFKTEEQTLHGLRLWASDPEAKMDKLRQLPICKSCEKAEASA